jgi:hypothetical protein
VEHLRGISKQVKFTQQSPPLSFGYLPPRGRKARLMSELKQVQQIIYPYIVKNQPLPTSPKGEEPKAVQQMIHPISYYKRNSPSPFRGKLEGGS